MARLARLEVFSPDEVAILHVVNRVVRRCFLMGTDQFTGKNYDYRKVWMENELKRLAAEFGVDLLAFSILSNHFHLILRSRPDVVSRWDDTEVARRWLRLCPIVKEREEPTEFELNSIRHDEDKLATIRRRLSDISWWMRLLCQRIAQRANREDEQVGKFFQERYRAVRLLDETALLACAAYVDLNPMRAAMAETIETSDHTSAQRRVLALQAEVTTGRKGTAATESEAPQVDAASTSQLAGQPTSCAILSSTDGTKEPDAFLAPVEIDEENDELGPRASLNGERCSDKGFLPLPSAKYLELLDWTARELASGKRGSTPINLPAIFERLSIEPGVWCELVREFGKLFSIVAGKPVVVEEARSRIRRRRHRLRTAARELLAV